MECIKKLSQDEPIAKTILPNEQHMEFFKSVARGEPNYDHGLNLSKL